MGTFVRYKTLAFQLRSRNLQDADRFQNFAADFSNFLRKSPIALRFSH